ncbi:MAG: hypothetical protein OEM38_12045, partial [Gammaproteobacteria bacterium]|nr:hypothetical protein [Gammaproteobacteria bacterium]
MDEIELKGGIETRDEGGAYRNIVIAGEIEANEKRITNLLGKFIDKGHWGGYLSGQTKLEAAIKIPILFENPNITSNLKLELKADLENVALSLPYPLGKQQGAPDSLELMAELSGVKRLLGIKTNSLDALFEIVPAGASQLITRGGVGFGQKAVLPTENGYRFIGRLERFSWAKWEPIIFPAENEIPLIDGDGAGGSQYFDVHIGRLEIFGSWFNETSVQASSGAQLWSIHLSGDELAGEVFIPVVLSSAPLIINMEKLVVVRGDTTDEVEEDVYLDPRKMPEVKVSAKSFVFNTKNFGALNLMASKIESGLHLDQFSMKTKYTDISATGDWVEVDGKQRSKFDILVNTSHLGKTITSWGFADAFGGGKGDVRIKANWAGKPSGFSFEVATGTMDINLKDASLLDFELGAAKMAGLFIPRRLLLDFRDVFKKGMLFDSIKGKYQIEDGNAFTADLSLDGPMADILMAGRIGLVAEDYDQLVTVNRRLVGDSISTLAALAANPLVNPLLAAQVYALKKLFEKQIDDILSVQYTIKGSWEAPKITPVVKNLKDRGAQIDELFE